MAVNTNKVIKEQAQQLFQSSIASSIVYLFVVLSFYALFRDIINSTLLTVWCGTMTTLAIIRLVLARLYLKKDHSDVKAWLRVFTLISLLVGLTWAGFSLLALLTDDPAFQYLFIVLASAVMSAAVPVLAAWTPAYFAHSTPQFFAIITVLIYTNNIVSYYLAICFVAFYLMLIYLHRGANRNFRNSFTLQHRNDELIDELNNEIKQREAVISTRTQELDNNLMRLNLALKAAKQGWFDLQPTSGKVAISPEYLNILGFDDSEYKATYQEWKDNLHPEDLDRVIETLNICLASGGPEEMEYRRKNKKGDWIWLHSVGEVIEWDKQRNPLRLVGIHTDITQRKMTELKLIESESRLLEAQKYAQIGHWELLADQQTAHWSDQMYHLFGLPINAKPGPESLCAITNESDFPGFIESVQRSFASHNEHHVEYRIKRPSDGEERWIECKGKVILAPDGSPEKISGFIQDITARKLSEQVLRVLAETDVNAEHNIFELIVQQLALSQGARYALIAQVDSNNPKLSNTVSVWADGSIVDNFSYELKGSPCNDVIGNKVCFYPKNIQQLFPDDALLVDMQAESYLGLPLINSAKQAIGLIAVLDDQPMKNDDQILNIMKSLASRASIELEREESIQKLNLSARVFSDTHEGITITDRDGLIIDINPAFTEITGYSREEVIGQNPSILSSGRQSPEFYDAMWQEVNLHGHWQGEVWNRKKNSELYAELLTISTLLDDNDNVINYVGVFSDITQSKQQQEKLSLMAHYDVLTQLPNRALFIDRFHQAIAHSKRTGTQFAICFLDLDNFKPVNDNFGHDVGDQLLIEVAERIKICIREEDTVSRQGGDEFALILNDLESYSQCEQTLVRIHHALAQPYLIDDYPHKITASSGVTLYPSDSGDIDTLLRHADQAMYQAKLSGKHRYQLFNTEQDQEAFKKHHLLAEIEQALSNDELALFYQPKVNMVTGDVFGVEALIRWHHPKNGLIPPLEFLPIIEGTELEIKIGNWVINKALIQLDDWLQQGIQLEVSINISSGHLQSNLFFAQLDTALARHRSVDSKLLQLEILETSALGDLGAVSAIIKSCQDGLGLNIALDDFGTGYSSLTHLRNLSANTIKIDQSFVRDMLDDPNDFIIINGVIGLANSFNRNIIAEGVETTEHGLMLLLLGCEEAQGYGIAKPMPADEVPDWLSQYTPNQEWLLHGNKHLTNKENKVKLFRLVSEQWQRSFYSSLTLSADEIKHWPILNKKLCHCGHWIKRAKQEQLFDTENLNELNKAHEHVHAIAQNLFHLNQKGDLNADQEGLTELKEAFNIMENALGRCE